MTHNHEALTAAAERAAAYCDDQTQILRHLERAFSFDGDQIANAALANETGASALRAIGPELARLTAENERLREALLKLANATYAVSKEARDALAGVQR